MNRPLICIGHRGASGYEPENTVRSVKRALELGADGVEVDVQFIRGQLVVFHDRRLERTTNGRGFIRRKSFEELRQLDAGLGEKVPILEEILDALDGSDAFLNIELKGRGTALPVAESIKSRIERGIWPPDRFLISSFLWSELRVFRCSAAAEIPIGLLLSRSSVSWRRAARSLRASTVNAPLKGAGRRLLSSIRQEGMRSLVYTVNSAEHAEAVFEMGADGVFTDFPDVVCKWRCSIGDGKKRAGESG